jgi:PAB-dependent poly(A)-specific ribonuclease subunit 2
VSVLRGQGIQEALPFIDDYISTSEPILDYLTEFSGIKPGDLDPKTSKHTVVPLKAAYKKLRMLVDLGCIFIGHGLLKDFRTINILLPSNQVIDTVDIFRLEGQRFESVSIFRVLAVTFPASTSSIIALLEKYHFAFFPGTS